MIMSLSACHGTSGTPWQVFWYVLDLPRPAFLAKISCAYWLPAAVLHCFTALCMFIPTYAVMTLACNCTTNHQYIIRMVFFGSILVWH